MTPQEEHMKEQAEIPTVQGDFGHLTRCLIAEMSEEEREAFGDVLLFLFGLPDRTLHALHASLHDVRGEFAPTWAN